MSVRMYSYLSLFIIITYLIRPAVPYIEYAVNKDFIAKNLCIYKDVPGNCCQGKCHLHKQVQKSAENSETDQNNKNKVQNKKVDDHLMVSTSITRPQVNTTNLSSDNRFAVIVPVYDPVFIPPEIKSTIQDLNFM